MPNPSLQFIAEIALSAQVETKVSFSRLNLETKTIEDQDEICQRQINSLRPHFNNLTLDPETKESKTTETLTLYRHGFEHNNSPVELKDDNEFHIQAIQYLRAALLIIKFSALDQEDKTELFKQIKALYSKAEKDLLASTTDDVSHQRVKNFENDLCAILHRNNLIRAGSKELNCAREWTYLLTPESPVCTIEKDADNIRMRVSRPIKLDEAHIRKYFYDAKSELNVTQQTWYQEVRGKFGGWIQAICHNEEVLNNVIKTGASLSPAGRLFPWLSNAKIEEELTGKLIDNKLEIHSTSRQIRAGIVMPYEMKSREARIRYATENLESLIRFTLEEQLKIYYDKFKPIVKSILEPRRVIDFPIHYQTFLSPNFSERFIWHKDNNGLFVHEKQQVIKAVQEKLQRNPSYLFKDIDAKAESEHKQSAGSDFKFKDVYFKPYLTQTNNPLNKLKSWYLSLCSVSDSDDIDHTNRLIANTANDIQALDRKLFFRKFTKTCKTKNKVPEKIEIHRRYDNYKLTSPLRDFTDYLTSRNTWPSFSYLSSRTKQKVEAIRNTLLQGEYTFLSKEAQIELAERMKAAYELRQMNREFIGNYVIRKMAESTYGLTHFITFPLTIAFKTIGSIWGFGSWVKNKLTGNNPALYKSALETICMGSRGVALNSCKSSRDRTGVKLAVESVIRETFHTPNSMFNTTFFWWNKIKNKARASYRHYFHSVQRYNHTVKLSDVGKVYAEIATEAEQIGIKTRKIFTKTMKSKIQESPHYRKSSTPKKTSSSKPTSSAGDSYTVTFKGLFSDSQADSLRTPLLASADQNYNRSTPDPDTGVSADRESDSALAFPATVASAAPDTSILTGLEGAAVSEGAAPEAGRDTCILIGLENAVTDAGMASETDRGSSKSLGFS